MFMINNFKNKKMNQIKRLLGIVWMAIGAVAVYYLFINQALGMWKAGGEKLVPAIIYTFILCSTFSLNCKKRLEKIPRQVSLCIPIRVKLLT